MIETEGKILIEALHLHASVGNIVYQLLHIIREEYRTAITRTRPALHTVQRFLQGCKSLKSEEENYTVNVDGLQEAVVDHLAEYQTELELSVHNIAEQAKGHIRASDIVMTIGNSALVRAFLLAKSQEQKPKFEVIVVEGAPFCEGHTLATSLAKQGIMTTLVPDSSIFALMPRVNKVIIGTSLVLGDGGVRATIGSYALSLCAKHHAVPVIVLAPTYKFSPRYGNERSSGNLHVNPQDVLTHRFSQIHVHNPAFDFVPPEYLTLILSNVGGYEASFTYLLLRELYGSTDIASV